MTVLLKSPWAGQAIGSLYTGSDEDYLVGVGKAGTELGRGTQITSALTAHVLTASDRERERNFTSGSAVTIRVAANVQDMPFGILATYRQSGAGQITVTGDAGVTIFSPSGFAKSAGQGAVIQLEKTDAMTVAILGSVASS